MTFGCRRIPRRELGVARDLAEHPDITGVLLVHEDILVWRALLVDANLEVLRKFLERQFVDNLLRENDRNEWSSRARGSPNHELPKASPILPCLKLFVQEIQKVSE
jgi:hypothetical protein